MAYSGSVINIYRSPKGAGNVYFLPYKNKKTAAKAARALKAKARVQFLAQKLNKKSTVKRTISVIKQANKGRFGNVYSAMGRLGKGLHT